MKNRLATALLLAGSASCASARWLRWSADEQPTVIPRETGAVPVSAGQGWTPRPTPAPGARKSDQDLVVEYLGRRQDSKGGSPSRNTWTNEQTCGWFKGTSSSAFTCADEFSCVTNEDHNVACGSGTYSPFFTVCLDHSAYLDGGCDDAGALTGCCQDSKSPACGTYIWTGSPTRSMYRCFESTQIISLLDLPQFVIDASISSSIAASKSSESERLKSLTASRTSRSKPAVPASTTADGSDDQPASATGEPAGAGDGKGSDGKGSDGDTTNNTTNNNGGHRNTPAIIGGAVGGILALIIICVLLCCLMRRRKRKNKNKTKKNTTSASGAIYNSNNKDKSKKKGLLGWAWRAISERRKNRGNVPVAGNKEKLSSDTSRTQAEEAPWPLMPVTPSVQREVPPPPPSVLQKSKRGPNAYPSSRHTLAANSSSATPGAPSVLSEEAAEQQQQGALRQQQASTARDSTNANTSSYPYLQRDVTGGSSVNDSRNPSYGGGSTASGFPPSHTQQFVVPMNVGAGVPTTSGANGSEAAQHPGSTTTAFYQQPQSTGGAPHNFTLVLNHYTTGSGAASEDARGPGAPMPGNLPPQFTGRSADSAGRYMRSQFTGESDVSDMSRRTSSVVDPRNSQAGYASHRGVPGQENLDRGGVDRGSFTTTPRRQHSQTSYAPSPPLRRPSRARTSRDGAASHMRDNSSGGSGGGGLGAEASALAMAGLSLDVNNTRQHENHYHQHHYAGTAASAPEPRMKPRYADSSTMTAASESAAGYPSRQVSGSGRAPAGFSVDVGFETGTETETGIGIGPRGVDGGATHHHYHYAPQVTGGSGSVGGTTLTESGAERGQSQDRDQGGTWYKRPVGMESDEPIELEASPALRKVD